MITKIKLNRQKHYFDIQARDMMKLEEFRVDVCIRGYHIYKDIWYAVVGKVLVCEKEPNNSPRIKISTCLIFAHKVTRKNILTTKITHNYGSYAMPTHGVLLSVFTIHLTEVGKVIHTVYQASWLSLQVGSVHTWQVPNRPHMNPLISLLRQSIKEYTQRRVHCLTWPLSCHPVLHVALLPIRWWNWRLLMKLEHVATIISKMNLWRRFLNFWPK